MHYPRTHRLFTGFFAAIGLAGLVACASLTTPPKQKEDPQVLELQQRLDQIRESMDATQQKVEDTYQQLLELQTKSASHEKLLNKLAGQPLSPAELAELTEETPKQELGSETVQTTPRAESGVIKDKSETSSVRPASEQKREKYKPSSAQSPKGFYQKAYETYKKRLYDQAMALFQAFLDRYPQDDLAGNAQYWLGEIYYDLGDYPKAIDAFKDVMVRYPESNKVPAALLKIGFSYIELDDLASGRFFLGKVLKNYPASDVEVKAKLRLREIETSQSMSTLPRAKRKAQSEKPRD